MPVRKEDLIKTSAPGFMKDKKTNVIVNTDTRQHADFMRQRKNARRFVEMEHELAELKNIVAQLLSEKVNNS